MVLWNLFAVAAREHVQPEVALVWRSSFLVLRLALVRKTVMNSANDHFDEEGDDSGDSSENSDKDDWT